jgi:hypothetical protein
MSRAWIEKARDLGSDRGYKGAVTSHEFPGTIQRLQEQTREGGECAADSGAGAVAECAEEAAGARGVGADAEKLRRNAERAAEEIGVDAVKAAESLQGSHLSLEGGVAEIELILGGLIPFRGCFLASEFVGEIGEAGGVACARNSIRGGLLERVEGASDRALRVRCDGGFVGGAEAGIVEHALELRREDAAELLLLAEEALVECVDARKLRISELLRLSLGAAGHF